MTEFDTKIVVIIRDDFTTWQKLNVAAFTVIGLAGTEQIVGARTTREQTKGGLRPCHEEEHGLHHYTEKLFKTYNNDVNRAAVAVGNSENLKLVGLAIRSTKRHRHCCKGPQATPIEAKM